MEATTAIVLIGIAHPNDGGLSPTHMFELLEGAAADAAIAFQGDFAALSVVLYEGSTLAHQLDVLETMTHWQIDLFAPVWSKRRNLFTAGWKVDGKLADFPE